MDDLAIIQEIFGNLAPLIAVAFFGFKELRRLQDKHDKELNAMRQTYLELMKEMLKHISESNEILQSLEKRTIDNADIQSLVFDFFTKKLREPDA